MWRNTVVIHGVLKKKNYKTKFSTSFILKNKINKNNSEKNTNFFLKKDNFGKKSKKKIKKNKKNIWGKLKLNSQPAQY
jgi:hypothetical protein